MTDIKIKLFDEEIEKITYSAVEKTGAEIVSIKLFKNKNGISIDLYLNVPYGCRIPELAFDCQEEVKESAAAKSVFISKINIHIQGVIQ